jgi:hypothetical protein
LGDVGVHENIVTNWVLLRVTINGFCIGLLDLLTDTLYTQLGTTGNTALSVHRYTRTRILGFH